MLNVIEVGAQDNIDDSSLLLDNGLGYTVHRLMRCPFRSISKVPFGLMVALRLTGLTNLLYEVASASINASSLWPVYSRGLPLEPTAGSVVHSYHLLSKAGHTAQGAESSKLLYEIGRAWR